MATAQLLNTCRYLAEALFTREHGTEGRDCLLQRFRDAKIAFSLHIKLELDTVLTLKKYTSAYLN